jgi:hypothetical protein
MRDLENVVSKTFEVDGIGEVNVRTFLGEDIAQILVDGNLVAEYGFGGAGCIYVLGADTRILIDIIAEIAHSGISKMRG